MPPTVPPPTIPIDASLAPRDRILAAAGQLFHRRGVGATGVDLLIDVAGVAKATFYRYFPSKDDLVVAWLEDPHTRWFDRVRGEAEAVSSTPDGVLAAFFDGVIGWLEADRIRGCPYLNIAVEIPDTTHPARLAARAYLAEIERWMLATLQAAGREDAQSLSARLMALLCGGVSLSAARHDMAPARVTARSAQRWLGL